MSKGDIAKENFLSGLNCSQSVVLAFKDEIDVNEDDLLRLSTGFGGGFARLRLICGAVSGMNMVISYIANADKSKVYAIIRQAVDEFTKETGTIMCGELLSGVPNVTTGGDAEKRSTEYYKKRPCADICKLAGDIAEKVLKENGYLQ